MSEYLTREQVLDEVRARLGGYGSAKRLARLSRVTPVAGAKWLREGIPRERVGIVSVVTGLPAHVIRPDEFVPPIPARPKGQSEPDTHGGTLAGSRAA